MWKVIGLVESRSGDVEFLPEWSVGKPNEFQSQADANTICDAMQAHVERLKALRTAAAPGVGGSAGPSIRYMVLPAIDDQLIDQLHGGAVAKPQVPAPPALSFGGPRQPS